MKSSYIKGFDGLRGISIIFVVLTHLGVYSFLYSVGFYSQRIVMLVNGTTGVNIFFAISGFLITTILLKEKLLTGKIHFKNFFIRRVLRLLPTLLLFYLTVYTLMGAGLISENYIGLIISFIYLYNFVPNKYYLGELGHTWSLAVEEQFYLFWPFAVFFFRKYKLLFFSILIVFLSILLIKIIPFLYFSYHGKIFYLTYIFNTTRWFLPAGAAIMIGASTAILNFHKDKYVIIFFNSIACLCLGILFYACPLYLPYCTFDYLFTFQELGISLLLVWIFHHQNSLLTNLFEIKPLVFIGRISYGIYVWQGLFLKTSPGGNLKIQQFPLNIMLVLIVSIISYYTIEKYALSFKNKYK
jgi:peptidoglycan/LPS O-acetylase OafA/YrhL